MCPNDVSLFGFFQTEKYFANIKDEIARDFTFHDSISAPVKESLWIRWIRHLSFFTFVAVILTSSMLGDLSGRTRNARRNIHHNRWPITRKLLKEFPEDQPVIICSDSLSGLRNKSSLLMIGSLYQNQQISILMVHGNPCRPLYHEYVQRCYHC